MTKVLGFVCLVLCVHAHAADKMYGVFMVVKGGVQIQASGKPASPAKVGAKVFEGDKVITAVDSRAKIVMSDRNVLNLNPETTIEIAQYQNDAASGKKNVQINLAQGKLRTNVEQTYDGEKSKFQIKTPTAVAGVRGTQFQTGFDSKTQMTSIVTFKGAVALAAVNPQGQVVGSPVIVKKGEMTTAAPNKAPEAPKAVPKEEMKKMDAESVATSAPAPAGDSAKDSKDSKEAKDGNSKESSKDGSKDTASKDSGNKDSGSKETASKDAGSPGKREVASEATAPAAGSATSAAPAVAAAAPAPTMIDSKDMDVGIAKDIKPVVAPIAPPPVPTLPKTTTTTDPLKDVTRPTSTKTSVTITPRPSSP